MDHFGHLALIVLLAGSAVAAPAASGIRPSPRAPSPLRQMSRADLESAKVLGSGCFWSLRGDRGTRLAMVGDRAAVRTAEGIVILSAAPGSKDMFPFTHDRWTSSGGRITLTVRQSRKAISVGEESVTTEGDVELRIAGRSRTMHGIQQCGS